MFKVKLPVLEEERNIAEAKISLLSFISIIWVVCFIVFALVTMCLFSLEEASNNGKIQLVFYLFFTSAIFIFIGSIKSSRTLDAWRDQKRENLK